MRVHPRVWRRDHELSQQDEITAAQLAMPFDAHLTGITRLQTLGLDFGPRYPIRFVVARDHHIALDRIFLHRTKLFPPRDDVGVTVPAAFIAYCALARVIDAIKVGDWLLHHGHMTSRRCSRSPSTSSGARVPARRCGCCRTSAVGPARSASPRPGRSSSSPACRRRRSTRSSS